MVTLQDVQAQLKERGIVVRYWGLPELRVLPTILIPGEQIHSLVNGRYEGGFAMLVATDQRVILIDKKPLYLTIESLQYDMIAEVNFNARVMEASLCIMTVNKTLKFTTIRQRRLRDIADYVQRRVLELRNRHAMYWFQAAQEEHQQEPVQAYFVPVTNPYTRTPLTTRRNFLPRIPRRR